jgi:hypothetical protein
MRQLQAQGHAPFEAAPQQQHCNPPPPQQQRPLFIVPAMPPFLQPSGIQPPLSAPAPPEIKAHRAKDVISLPTAGSRRVKVACLGCRKAKGQSV